MSCCHAFDKTEDIISIAVEPSPEPVVQVKKASESKPTGASYAVHLVAAFGVRDADWFPGAGGSDCYCVVTQSGKELWRTKVVKDSSEPVWNEANEILLDPDAPITFGIFDQDAGGKSDSLGSVTVAPAQFADGLNETLKLINAGKLEPCLKVKMKKADAQYPDGKTMEFTISLSREVNTEKVFGLDLHVGDEVTGFVNKIKAGGYIENYNKTAQPENQVNKGDFIVAVNGKTGSAKDLLAELKGDKWEITITRPIYVTVDLDNTSSNAGMTFFPLGDKSSSLLVKSIREDSSVMTWGKANPSRALKVNDRIVTVDGMRATSDKIHATRKMRLLVCRPYSGSAEWWPAW